MHFLTLRGLLSRFIIPLIQQYTDEFVITNKRVIVKKGLIAIWTLEMNLQKIETVNVQQSIPGRIFGYGCLTLIGTGGTREKFKLIGKYFCKGSSSMIVRLGAVTGSAGTDFSKQDVRSFIQVIGL